MAIFATRPDKALVRELEAHLGRRVTVIAHGHGPEATLLATRELLALRSRGEWRVFGWEQIAHGAWQADAATFVLRTTTDEELTVQLDDAGRLPELLKERVLASTAVTVSHDLTRGRVQIVGRRRLGDGDELTWYAVAGGGADLEDESVAAFVVAETDRLRAEYGG